MITAPDTMVSAAMRFMYAYPETHGTDRDMLDAGPIAEVAQTAEAAGFGGFAFTEHPSPGARWLASGGHQSLDPFVALSYVAAVTTSMKLLTYLSVMPYRNPLLLAKTTATLDKLSGGRFILGVGTGYLKGEFPRSASTSKSATSCSTRRSTRCPCTGAANRSVTRAATSRPSSASAGRCRCSSRSRSGSAATPESRASASPNGLRVGCPWWCRQRWRRRHVHRWSAASTRSPR